MLIGHYAPALLLHRARPSIPLWVLFVATQALDVLWGLFVLTGVEHVRMVPSLTESNSLDLYDMPYSHGLVQVRQRSLLRAVAAELGLGRAMEILQGERARVHAVLRA
jgi:hypothetical protein